jgi:hypothetical protein
MHYSSGIPFFLNYQTVARSCDGLLLIEGLVMATKQLFCLVLQEFFIAVRNV